VIWRWFNCFLAFGASVDKGDINGNSALHAAAAHGHETIVQCLLKEKPFIDAMNIKGESPIHMAVKYPNIVKMLLNAGASVDAMTETKMTSLHYAIYALAPVETINVLLDAGADVTLLDNMGRTALMFANEKQSYLSPDYCRVLQAREQTLDDSAKLAFNSAKHAFLLGREDPQVAYGTTETPSLIEQGKSTELDNLKQLIKEQKIVIHSAKVKGEPILIAAINKGKMDIVLKLLQDTKHLSVKRTERDSTGKTALHYLAARDDSDDAIVELLKHKSSMQAVSSYWDPTRIFDNDNNNPFHILISHGKIDTLEKIKKEFTTKSSWRLKARDGLYNELYNAAFDVNKNGHTPIMIAAIEQWDKPELVRLCGKAMGLKPNDLKIYIDLTTGMQNNDKELISKSIKKLNANAKNLGWNSNLKLDSAQLLTAKVTMTKKSLRRKHLRIK